MNIKQVPSPNFSSRNGHAPRAVVIHIMEGFLSGTDSWFGSKDSKVSAHYGIGKTGEVHQYVAEKNAAWHAGRVATPVWKGIIPAADGKYLNPNLYTIGIEHEGNANSEWTDEMYASSAALVKDICARYSLPLDRDHVIGHHEIYAVKTCPGSKVDLSKIIALAGGAKPPEAGPVTPLTVFSAGSVVTTTRLNLRSKPDTQLPPVKTVEKGIALAYEGYTTHGETLHGNSTWYFTEDGSWFWSGGVK